MKRHDHGDHGERCRAPGCGATVTSGTYICAVDLAEHDERLADLPLIAHALDERFLRQQRFSVAGLGYVRQADDEEESAIPFDPKAGELRRRLTRLLVRWCSTFDVVDRLGYPSALGYNRLPPTTTAMVAHLRRHNQTAAVHPLAADYYADVHTLYRKALQAVDRPPDLVYLGICSWPTKTDKDGRPVEVCPEDLYAEWGKDHARCRGCKHQHEVKTRQTILLNAVKDQLATAADIARGLSGLDVAVTAERIRKWKERGRIAAHGTKPLYRVGDVVDLVLAERQRLKAELRQPSKAQPQPAQENA